MLLSARGTLYKLEKGDPFVSMEVYATALTLVGLVEKLGQIADRREDLLWLDIDENHMPKKIQPRRPKSLYNRSSDFG